MTIYTLEISVAVDVANDNYRFAVINVPQLNDPDELFGYRTVEDLVRPHLEEMGYISQDSMGKRGLSFGLPPGETCSTADLVKVAEEAFTLGLAKLASVNA